MKCYQVSDDWLLTQKIKKLKLHNASHMFISETVLPVSPIGSVLLNSTTAIVSTGKHGILFYIKINDRLSVAQTRTTDLNIGPMVKCGDSILIINGSGGTYCVSEMDHEGKIVKHIKKDDKSLFRNPISIGLSPDQATVYVTDHLKGCIGLSLEGQITFRYQEAGIMEYRGLAVDRNCCYIGVQSCDPKCLQIRMIDFNRKKILQSVCTNHSQSYPVGMENNILVAVNMNCLTCPNICFYLVT